jgi:hypothetical protein
MNLRNPWLLVLVAVAAAFILLPGHGLLGPAAWWGEPHAGRVISMAAVIFCAVYFGTLKLWELITGERLEKPLPEILALFLLVRLTVDCARMLMWW